MAGLRTLILAMVVLAGFKLPGSNVLLISSNYTGKATGDYESPEFAISPDGRYVAFASSASDLETSDTNRNSDIYLLDRLSGVRKCISSPTNRPYHLTVSSSAYRPVLSGDGRFVGFLSNDPFLVPAITNYPHQGFTPANLFICDTVSNRYFLGSPNGNAWTPWPSSVGNPALSSDGRYASFVSTALYRADLQSGVSEPVSVDGAGRDVIVLQVIARTPDHRFFVFASAASNMIAGVEKTNTESQIYWRDMDQRITKLVSIATNGGYANSNCFARAMSRDGRYVAFRTRSTNLQPGMGWSGGDDLFVRDMVSNETWCVTASADGRSSMGNSARVPSQQFSADGSTLFFETYRSYPPWGTTVQLHDLSSRTNRVLATNGYELIGNSLDTDQRISQLSSDGRYAVFASDSLSLVSVDVNTLRTQTLGKIAFGERAVVRITADSRLSFFASNQDESAGLADTNRMSDIFVTPTVSPRIERVVAANTTTVEGTAFPDDTVRLEASEDLQTWSTIDTRSASEEGTVVFQDESTADNSKIFYRLASP